MIMLNKTLIIFTPAGQGRQASGLEAPSWLCTVPGGQGNSSPRVSPGGQ